MFILVGCSHCCDSKGFYILFFLLFVFVYVLVAVFCNAFQHQHAAFYALLLYHNKKPQVPMIFILYQFAFYAYPMLCFTLYNSVSSLLHYFIVCMT